jgi:hypothetical protein
MGLSYATFSDPDDNSWLFQEITTRLPGRTDARKTTCKSVRDLASALRRAAAAQGQHETRIGGADKNWPELVRLVHDHGAGRPGSANISSPTDSSEESNHAF